MINRAVFVLFEVRELVLADVDHVGGCEEYRGEVVRVVRIVRGVESCVQEQGIFPLASLFRCRENT